MQWTDTTSGTTLVGRRGLRTSLRALQPAALILFISTLLAAPAEAQWSVVNLHPNGAVRSEAHGIGTDQQTGSAEFAPNFPHALVWTATADTFTDLNPTGSEYSVAAAVLGGQQVGFAVTSGVQRASLWRSTADSWVDLTPSGSTGSWAFGIEGNQQVGQALIGGYYHAGLWTGSAASWVDLMPTGYVDSVAYGVDSGRQVGAVRSSGYPHASLWYGSADSWCDLHPSWATGSYAYAIDGAQQVGITISGLYAHHHATVWYGSSAALVDLQPSGVGDDESDATCVHNGQQAGSVWVRGPTQVLPHASLWKSSATSWIDLQQFLPSEFQYSYATGIWDDGVHTYVVGYGFNTTTSNFQALMWVGPPPVTVTARMINWKTLRVTVAGTWPGEVTSYHLTSVINGTSIDMTHQEQGDPTYEDIDIDLTRAPTGPGEFATVPRFADVQRFDVHVSAVLNGQETPPVSGGVTILLPVVVVPGITLLPGLSVADENFMRALELQGYVREADTSVPYVTLWGFSYDAHTINLVDASQSLQARLFDPLTGLIWRTSYASKVDMVAHSKGGLVARMLLRRYYDYTSAELKPVRRLIMACTPHTGAASAVLLPMFPDLGFSRDAYEELMPTSSWIRKWSFQRFKEQPQNVVLKALNGDVHHLQGVNFYLLYGYGESGDFGTAANYTVNPGWFNTSPGDGGVGPIPFGVLVWSAQGRETNNVDNFNGDSFEGPLIRAFDPSQGGVAPKSVEGFPLNHTNFLRNTSARILEILLSPSP